MFTVYSKDSCPYCYKIQQVLELTGKKFITYKLNKDFDKETFYNIFGEGSTFPQVLFDGNKIGGCNETIKFIKNQKVTI